jgi:hypothetical protein
MMRPTSQLGDVYGVRIILAAAWYSYKSPTNFVFFVLAENDNNNEKGDLDFAASSGQARGSKGERQKQVAGTLRVPSATGHGVRLLLG